MFNSIVRPWQEVPRTSLNRTLLIAVWAFGLSGAMGGLDDGTISGMIVLPSYTSHFHLTSEYHNAVDLAGIKGNIISLAQIGAMIGSLFAWIAVEKLGRLNSLRCACFFNYLGAIIQLTANSVGQVYAGRIIIGMATGVASVCSPTYIAEVAPKSIRGACGICYNPAYQVDGGSYFIGLIMGYFANYGSSSNISGKSNAQWLLPLGLTFIFPSIILVSSFWAPESPRWLIKRHKQEQALKTFARLRHVPEDHQSVALEIKGIEDQLEREHLATEGMGAFGALKELFGTAAMRYRVCLSLGVGMMGQWGGGGAFTAYAPTLFELLGVSGNTGLLTTGVYGIVKLVVTLIVAFFILDRLGRKMSLYGGISLQILAAGYIAIFLSLTSGIKEVTPTQQRAGTGAVAMIFVQGTSWALGWNAVQHPINAEIYPLRLRAIGTSLAVCFRTLMNFGANKALPSMLISIQPAGTFYFFAAEGVLAILWVWFFLPDTHGRALEELDALFDLPWYRIGRAGRKVADSEGWGLVEGIQDKDQGEIGMRDISADTEVRKHQIEHIE